MALVETKDNAIVIIIGTRSGINTTLVFDTEREFSKFLVGYDKDRYVIFKVEVMPPLGNNSSFLIKPKERH